MSRVSKLKKLKRDKRRKPDATVVDRRSFLAALKLTSEVLQMMGEEIEILRASTHLPLDLRRALFQMGSSHLKNVASISSAFQLSIFESTKLNEQTGRDLN